MHIPLFPGNKCLLESSGGQTGCRIVSSWLHTSMMMVTETAMATVTISRYKDIIFNRLAENRLL